jgi:hypothetical protein
MMTDKMPAVITALRAREIATEAATYDLADLVADKTIPLLRDAQLEAENCWIFFRNPEIVIPPERALSDFAYCVSKKGTARSIPDFSGDSVRLREYLIDMSGYFKERGL